MATPVLDEYQRKRDFRRSPEPDMAVPAGAEPALLTGHLYVMHKHAARRLHFDLRIEQDGMSRSWALPRGAPLERGDIVRSYEIEKYHYVVAEDEELVPKKSREIDLKRFVPLSSINPVYFERAYFLVPDSDTPKACRLLARSMEDEQRAAAKPNHVPK